MKKVHAARLKKLAMHMLIGDLGHKAFSFEHFNLFPDAYRGRKNKCGTMGCAIGECPIIFKDHWRFSKYGSPELISNSKYSLVIPQTQKFFGLSFDEAGYLFYPYEGDEELPEGRLPASATREEVGINILKFMKKKKVL
jgi:hypothetical protein